MSEQTKDLTTQEPELRVDTASFRPHFGTWGHREQRPATQPETQLDRLSSWGWSSGLARPQGGGSWGWPLPTPTPQARGRIRTTGLCSTCTPAIPGHSLGR